MATIQLQNPFGRVVEEVAIVRDGNHSAAKALQELLQPLHTFGIQVVGGLVQQQHVGFAQQQLAQRHAAFFTAREVFDDGIPRWQAQRIGRNFQLVLAVGSGGGDDGFELALLFAQGVKVGVWLGVCGVDFFQPRAGVVHFFHGLFHRLAHGVLGIELRLLRQVANVQTRHGNSFAFNFLVQPRHDLEQRGFARTVQAQHANLGAREEAERNVFQNVPLGWHDFANAVHGENVLSHLLLSLKQ